MEMSSPDLDLSALSPFHTPLLKYLICAFLTSSLETLSPCALYMLGAAAGNEESIESIADGRLRGQVDVAFLAWKENGTSNPRVAENRVPLYDERRLLQPRELLEGIERMLLVRVF